MDIYSTRAQLAAIELMPPEHSFLYDTFVQELAPVEDKKAIWDFKKGTKPMAPVVHDGTGGVLMGRDSYDTREIGFCTIAPERVIEPGDIAGRMFGENVLGAMTPEQRAKKMLVTDQMEMRAAIQRRREWMARQVLLTGKLSVFRYTNEGRDLDTTMIADYGFTNTVTTTSWASSSATIDADMHTLFDLVYDGCGYVDMILMAPDAAAAMMANSNYIKQFDGRNIDMGKINTMYKGAGVRFIGWNSDGVEMYSMSGKFVDDDGQTKAIIPSGKVIAGSKGVLKCVHGPVTQVEDPGPNAMPKTYIKKEVPLRYGSISGNAVMNRITSCPTIVPFNVDGWAVATVL